ncbi:MAG: 6-phosphogluconolactonase [Gammaproteobacteria bacterium]|nr:6-phosphogluconolactonase [Gammaproteobacteria bacterium]
MSIVHVLPNIDTIARTIAARWTALSHEAVTAHNRFHVALAGGSTPRRLYETLASLGGDGQTGPDWAHTCIYFGDERAVPPDHPDSNYRMARESLLDQVPLPPEQVHRIRAEEADLPHAARSYAELLNRELPLDEEAMPAFDLVLLGLGEDGHTASLFPDTEILAEHERLVAPVYVDRLNAWRVSLTLPVLNHARHIMVLVSGEAKAAIAHRVLDLPPAPALPAQLLAPTGSLEWFLDEAAAAQLEREAI